MVKLTESRFQTHDKKKQAELELDEGTLHRCRTIIGDALSGCTPVSRLRLMGLLEEAGISTKNGRGYYILGYLGRTGMICFGPHEGKQQSFVRLMSGSQFKGADARRIAGGAGASLFYRSRTRNDSGFCMVGRVNADGS